MKNLTEEELALQHPCIINHIERAKNPISVADGDICSFSGKMYDTYGEDIAFVLEMAKQNRVLTIIESDEDEIDEDGESQAVWYVVSGMHVVNRIGYLVTEQPIIGEDFEVKLEY